VNHGVAATSAEQMGMMWGIGSIVLFLIIGFGLLLWVRDEKAEKRLAGK
jgi:hypothetical protein